MFRCFAIFALFAFPVFAESNSTKVEEKPLIIKKSFKGVLISKKVDEVKIKKGEWASWIVEEAAAHGSMVKAGDVLLKLKKDDFDTMLMGRRRGMQIMEITLKKQQYTYKHNKKKRILDLIKVKEDKALVNKQVILYSEKGHKHALQLYVQQVADAKQGLEYQQEELKQLEKMYSADKITEETEEIVLKRQRNYVKKMEDRIKAVEFALEEAQSFKLPSAKFAMKYKKETLLMDSELRKMDIATAEQIELLKLQSAESAFKKQQVALNKLIEQGSSFEVKAVSNGLVFYGSLTAGKWLNKNGTLLKKDTVLTPGAVILSVIDPNEFVVKGTFDLATAGSVDEKWSFFMSSPGAAIRKVTLVEKATIPDNGVIKVKFNVSDSKGLFNGVPVNVQAIKKVSDKAILITKNHLHTEELDLTKTYVKLKTKDGFKKVYVTTAPANGSKLQVLDGLKAGDVILK